MGGIIGFELSNIEFLLRVHEVPESEWCFELEKLTMLTNIALGYWNTESAKTT